MPGLVTISPSIESNNASYDVTGDGQSTDDVPDREVEVNRMTEHVMHPRSNQQEVISNADRTAHRCIRQMCTVDWILQEADDVQVHAVNTFPAAAFTPAAQIGRQLALIGDDMHRRHRHHHHQQTICILNMSRDAAYQTLINVVCRLICHSNRDWEHVITLLCFGYRLSQSDLQGGIHGLLQDVVGFVINYTMADSLVTWLLKQTEWRSFVGCLSEYMTWPLGGVLCTGAAISTSFYLFLRQKHT